MAVAAAAIVTAAIGAGMAISGAIKQGKANRLARANKRPEYSIAPEEQSNLNIAQSLAGQGLSDSSKQFYTQQSQRGLSSTIDAILKGGGDVNAINNSYGAYQDGISRLAVADDQQKLSNINLLIAQQTRMSDQRDKAWQINQYAPYADKAAAYAKMKADGNTQMWQGIGQIGSAVGSFASAKGQQNATQQVNGGGGGGGFSSPSMMQPASDSGGFNRGVNSAGDPSGNTSNMALRYNPSTGTYMKSSNWETMSPEQRTMMESLWNNSSYSSQTG